ncbi:MAG: hypothetical protein KGL39_13915 [Patescibacteria group bacterium]|nr:hypothetical protein [Patescibacteria group bacterium]
MPQPVAGESLADYLHRFMGSAEAKGSFPKKKQRVAVAYSLFKKRKKRK